jgi:hypothetical protein
MVHMSGMPQPPSPPNYTATVGGRNKVFLPGDVKSLDTKGLGEGLPIWKRIAVILRSYPGLEVFEVMKGFDNYDRSFMERTQFMRAIENLVGKPWIELAMTSDEFEEICKPYYTKNSGPGGPPPMIQYRRFALEMQRYADQELTDDDITKAQELRGYVNPGDQERNDGFFSALPGQEGMDMSPDRKRLKKHQSPQALASGIWEYEDIPDDENEWDTGDDRRPGEATAASRLGWGAGAKKAIKADAADMTEFERARQVRDHNAGNLYEGGIM